MDEETEVQSDIPRPPDYGVENMGFDPRQNPPGLRSQGAGTVLSQALPTPPYPHHSILCHPMSAPQWVPWLIHPYACELTREERADLLPAGDATLRGVLANDDLQKEDGQAAPKQKNEVGDEECT